MYRFVVITRARGSDAWDVALFAERGLAEGYYLIYMQEVDVEEAYLAIIETHHERR